jgi:carboxyl-terminal processing protease
LRDNTGGYFDQAYRLANEFLERGDMIVYMEGRNRPKNEYRADGKGSLKNIQISVLVNEGSASSSEIFAGAIQDNDRGAIVGRRSFGKGLVQEPINFTDGSGVRLTVARFYTPSGRCIQKPYSDDYAYDMYERYRHGEMTNADSMKVDKSEQYFTVGGRIVYGGGGIIPDIFVPMDTTAASKFFINCNKKSTQMRFAAAMFDKYKPELSKIEDFSELQVYLKGLDLESQFLAFAKAKDKLTPDPKKWAETKGYMMPQVIGLVGRYSKLGEEAFYRYYMDLDDTIEAALKNPSVVETGFGK